MEKLDIIRQEGLLYHLVSGPSLLRWRDVDFERKLITIPFSKAGKREHIPLNTSALAALVRLRARHAPDAPVDDLLVCETTEWAHRQWWGAVKQEAQIQPLRWHDLRHTFVSRLVMANVNVLTVQRLMRHETLTMTLRYAHLAPSHLHEAVEKIAECTKSVQRVSNASQNARAILQ